MKKIINLIKNTSRATGLSLKFSKGTTIALIVGTIFIYILPVYQSKVMGDLVNAVIEKVGSGVASMVLVKLVILYALVWFLTTTISSINNYVQKIWYHVNELQFNLLIAKKRAEIDIGHYENPKFLNLMTRALTHDFWPVIHLTEIQFTVFGGIATFLLTSVIATSLSWKVYLIIVISAIPTFIVNLKYSTTMWSIWGESSERKRKYQHLLKHLEDKQGIIQSKILQASGKLLFEIKEILNGFKKDQMSADKRNVVWSVLSGIFLSLGVGIGFYMIIIKVTTGQESVGSMVFLVGILGQLVGSVSTIISNISKQIERNLYVNDIFEVLDTKPFLKLREDPISLDLKEPPLIEFKNVWFKYQGSEKWILKNINLTIKPGEKIAMVGNNGAGKSTFVKLLARIYDPEKGQILINGIDLRDIDPNDWSYCLGILLQDYISYDFKIGESIAMGRSDEGIDSEKIIRSAKHTSADSFIEDYELKYDQQLGRDFDGIELSKGQQQKIALSRMIYRDALVTILDEPTAAIDALSETHIFEQMTKASTNKTLFVITHRFNTTKDLGRIVVIENGGIVEDGSHDELIEKEGRYKKMFDSQARSFYKEKKQKGSTV